MAANLFIVNSQTVSRRRESSRRPLGDVYLFVIENSIERGFGIDLM